jgi:hypothetical protein
LPDASADRKTLILEMIRARTAPRAMAISEPNFTFAMDDRWFQV